MNKFNFLRQSHGLDVYEDPDLPRKVEDFGHSLWLTSGNRSYFHKNPFYYDKIKQTFVFLNFDM